MTKVPQKKKNSRKFISTREAASLVGYTTDYVARLAREKKVVAKQVNKQWMINCDSLESFVLKTETNKRERKENLRLQRLQERAQVQSVEQASEARQQISLSGKYAVAQTTVLFLSLFLVANLTWFSVESELSVKRLAFGLSSISTQLHDVVVAPSVELLSRLAFMGQTSEADRVVSSNDVAAPTVFGILTGNTSSSVTDTRELAENDFQFESSVSFFDAARELSIQTIVALGIDTVQTDSRRTAQFLFQPVATVGRMAWCSTKSHTHWSCEGANTASTEIAMERQAMEDTPARFLGTVAVDPESLLASAGTSWQTAWCSVRALTPWECETSSPNQTPINTIVVFTPIATSSEPVAITEVPRSSISNVTNRIYSNENASNNITNQYYFQPVIQETVVREVLPEGVGRSRVVTQGFSHIQTNRIFDTSGALLNGLRSDLAESVLTDELSVSGTSIFTGPATFSSTFFATDPTANNTIAGSLAVGTTTSLDTFTLDGAAYLAPLASIATTTNRLYNTGGTLTWAGSAFAGPSIGTWATDGTNAWRATGNVGIGTTTPGSRLSVSGGGVIGSSYAGTAAPSNGLLVQGNVGIGTTTPSYKLDVNGTARFVSAVTLDSTLGVTGITTLTDLVATNSATLATTTITNAAVSGTLDVDGATILSSTLGVTGLTTLATTTANGLITGSAGLTIAGGDVSLPTNTIDSSEITDATIVSADISATAAITDGQINDDLTIDGGTIDNTTIGATTPSTAVFTTATTTGAFTVQGALAALSATITNAFQAASATITGLLTTGSLTVTNTATTTDLVATNSATLATTTITNAAVSGTLDVDGATILSSTLGVTGLTTLATTTANGLITGSAGLTIAGGDVSLPTNTIDSSEITDATIVSADISATAAITDGQVNNDLTIDGGTINDTTIGAVTPSTAVFTTATTTGAFTVQGALTALSATITNAFQAASATITGLLTTDTLVVTNTATTTDLIATNSATLATTTITDASIFGTLDVTGNQTNTADLAINGNTTLGDASGDAITANAAAWTFANDTTFALSGGVDGLNFDSNTLSIDAANNRVGIGTGAPLGKAHIYTSDTGLTAASTNADNLIIEENSSGGITILTRNTSTGSIYFADADHSGLGRVTYNHGDDELGLTAGGGERVTLTSSLLTVNPSGTGFDVNFKGQNDDDLLYLDGSADSVGIGDTTPDYKLDVAGTAGFDGLMTMTGSAANIALGSNFLSGDGDDEGVFVDSSGNVGIGTAAPVSQLTIQRTESASGGDGDSQVTLISSTGGNISSGYSIGGIDFISNDLGNATTSAQIKAIASASHTTSVLDTDLAFFTKEGTTISEKMRITDSGNVGIGTTSPSAKLTLSTSDATGDTILFDNLRTSQGAEDVFGSIDFSGSDTSANADGVRAQIRAEAATASGAADLVFSTANAAVAGINEIMRIDYFGRIGIGTITPAARLSIQTKSTMDILNLFETSGTEVFTVLESGNVGIGTTAPGQKLDVVGNVKANNLFVENDIFHEGDPDTKLSFTNNSIGLETSGSERLRIDSSGNVGIGDTSPDYLLDVAGTAGFDGDVTLGDASADTVTANAAAWTFANDTTFALSGGVDGLNFDSNTLSIDAANNRVGIGTAAPEGSLHVMTDSSGSVTAISDADDLVVESASSGGISVLTADTSNGYLRFGSPTDSAGAALQWNLSNKLFRIGTTNSGSSIEMVVDNNTAAMTLLSGGNVGIGTSTPSAKLTVASSDTSANTSSQINLIGGSGNALSGDVIGGVDFYSADLGNINLVTKIQGVAEASHVSGSVLDTGLALYVTSGTTTGEAVRIDSAGNVGIGTASPARLLSISGDSGGDSGTVSTQTGILITDTGNSNTWDITNPFASIDFSLPNEVFSQVRARIGLTMNITNGNQSNLSFFTSLGSDEALERMTIDNSGNIGIGDTTPDYLLDVAGTSGFDGLMTMTGSAANIALGSNYLSGDGGDEGLAVDSTGVVTLFAGNQDITPDSSGTSGQLVIDGNGYSSVIALDATAMYIGHNASSRALTFQTDETDRLTITGAGNVGIGTTNPGEKLDISGGRILLDNAEYYSSRDSGGTARGILSLNGDDTTILQSPSGNDIFLKPGTVTTMTLKDGGNVGIGDTSPDYLLDVAGTAGFDGLMTMTGSAANIALGSNYLSGDGGDEGVFVDGSGNVGVGTTTPQHALHIYNAASNASVSIDGSSFAALYFTERDQAVDNRRFSQSLTGGNLRFQALNDAGGGGGDYIELASVGNNITGIELFDNAGLTNRISTAGDSFFTSGNVGIGTTAPDGLLHIYQGASGQSAAAAGGDELVIEGSGNTGLSILSPSSNVGSIYFGDETSAARGRMQYDHSEDDLSLWTLGSERLTIDSSGNVGIGTTTPGSLLTVAGNMELTGLFYDSAGSSGIFGDVLQRGSSGLTWVATSTLGIGGAGGADDDDTVVSRTFTSSSTWNALTGLSASTTVGVRLDTTNLVTGSLSLMVDGATTTVLAVGATFDGLVVANSTVSVVAEDGAYYGFDVSTASFVDSFDVSGQETNPDGIAFSPDGLKMFVLGTAGDDVNEYTLSTTFDVSTASFVDSFSVSGQDTSPVGLAFSSDGLKMFVLGYTGQDINEYTLSTTFDVSTASFVDSFDVSGQESQPRSVAFSTDGLKMFVLGTAGDDVNEYTLSAAFDVSTASFVDSFDVSGQETLPRDLAFSPDGLKMFVMGWKGDDVNEYTLSAAFDVSTASFVDSFYVGGQEANATDVAFSTDGTKMFVIGIAGDDVNEYNVSGLTSFGTSASALITTEGDFGGADLAELYPVTDTNIAAGDIVSFIDNDSFALTYATAESSYALAGVVSTDPGITLSDSTEGREAVPLALSGRVPVKVNLEGGLIVPGDRITPSSVPGVGRKATLFEPSIGTALTAYNPENPDEQQLVTVFVRLEEGVNVYNLTDTLFAGASTTFMMPLATTFSTTTGTTTETVTITENIAVSIWNRLADLASRFVDGVLTLAGLKAEKVETVELETTKLCIGNTCVDEDTLRALLQSADLVNSGSEEDSEIDTETDEETSSENQQEDEDIESSDSDTNDIVDTPTNSSEDTDTADIVDTPTNSSEDTDTASQDDFATTTNTYISTETPTTSTDNIPEETDNTTQIIEETPEESVTENTPSSNEETPSEVSSMDDTDTSPLPPEPEEETPEESVTEDTPSSNEETPSEVSSVDDTDTAP